MQLNKGRGWKWRSLEGQRLQAAATSGHVTCRSNPLELTSIHRSLRLSFCLPLSDESNVQPPYQKSSCSKTEARRTKTGVVGPWDVEMVDRIRPDSNARQKQISRTCCDMCHIKLGAVFLGCVEAAVAVFVLIGVVQQVVWKNQHSSLCAKNLFRDCLIFQFNHFNVTLIFDYIVILMMIFILFSVLLLFCGVLTDTSCLILPHIIVQAIFLLFSLGYFILYAWSYFYGDLHTYKRPFMFQSFVERMWLATLLLALAGLQSYLFSSVIRCSLYLANIEDERRRRERAFERCSERVRIAKENGLWRTTSWGGGFQQYKGQFDKPKKEPKHKGFHVQWNADVEVSDERAQLVKISEDPPISLSPIDEESPPVALSEFATNTRKERRASATSAGSGTRRFASESPKKDRPRLVKKTSSEGHNRMDSEIQKATKEVANKPHIHHHKEKPKEELTAPKRIVKLRPSESSKGVKDVVRRPPLRSNRSVDSGEHYDEVVAFHRERTHGARRRSSEEIQPIPAIHHHRIRSGERKTHDTVIPIVKKVSITATMG
ncbi:unnamed protein product [Caenorhabditis auriculariae]|uniref:Uncharacterized protein n=1 Tax=Caenorhabditis auriculariae TaxID=2777116 RepID=A0A8S1GUY9_9PELO|nr:unnamed protein product [Caenorhabditis auriculariae]